MIFNLFVSLASCRLQASNWTSIFLKNSLNTHALLQCSFSSLISVENHPFRFEDIIYGSWAYNSDAVSMSEGAWRPLQQWTGFNGESWLPPRFKRQVLLLICQNDSYLKLHLDEVLFRMVPGQKIQSSLVPLVKVRYKNHVNPNLNIYIYRKMRVILHHYTVTTSFFSFSRLFSEFELISCQFLGTKVWSFLMRRKQAVRTDMKYKWTKTIGISQFQFQELKTELHRQLRCCVPPYGSMFIFRGMTS